MKVSIIIPVYKVESYIEDCLKSVFNQTYSDIELILVNDCTPDKSWAIAKKFLEKQCSNGYCMEIQFLEHKLNRGLSVARNTGINAATGDYLFFMDSDDEITSDCIMNLVQPLKKKFYDFVLGEYKIVGSDKEYPQLKVPEGEIIGNKEIFHEYCYSNFYMMACNKLCKKAFIKDNDLYFEEGMIHEDNLWSLKVALVSDSLYAVRKQTYIYKIRHDSITESGSRQERMRNKLPLLHMLVDVINNTKNHYNYKDKFHFLDINFEQKYISCISNGWWKEYIELRKIDIRPYHYIISNSLKSKKYFRRNGHRLFTRNIGYYLYRFMFKWILFR